MSDFLRWSGVCGVCPAELYVSAHGPQDGEIYAGQRGCGFWNAGCEVQFFNKKAADAAVEKAAGLQAQIESLNSDIAAKTQQLTNAQREYDAKIKSNDDAYNARIAALEKSAADKKTESDGLVAKYTADINALNAKNKAEIDKIKSDNAKEITRINGVNAEELRRTGEINAAAQKKMDDDYQALVTSNNAKQKKATDDYAAQVKTLTDTFNKTNDELKAKIAQSAIDIANLQASNAAGTAKLRAEFDAVVVKYEGVIDQKNKDIKREQQIAKDTLAQIKADLEVQLATFATEQTAKKQAIIDGVSESIDVYVKKSEARAAEISASETKLKGLKEQYDKLLVDVGNAQAKQINKLADTNNAEKELANQLSSIATQYNVQIDAYTTKMADLRKIEETELANLKAEHAKQIADEQARLAQIIAGLEASKRTASGTVAPEIAALNATIDEYKKKAADARVEYDKIAADLQKLATAPAAGFSWSSFAFGGVAVSGLFMLARVLTR